MLTLVLLLMALWFLCFLFVILTAKPDTLRLVVCLFLFFLIGFFGSIMGGIQLVILVSSISLTGLAIFFARRIKIH